MLFPRKEYDNAIKKYKKAIALMENYHKTNTADARSANLLSNLHNNLSTAYLFRKKLEEAVSELKTAFTVRREYASLGLIEIPCSRHSHLLTCWCRIRNMILLWKLLISVNPPLMKLWVEITLIMVCASSIVVSLLIPVLSL